MLKTKYFALFLLTVVLTLLFIPLIFWIELILLAYVPGVPDYTLQVGIGDALTMASVLGAVGVFALERYWSAARDELDRIYSGALRLMIKHVREQQEPSTIEELWEIFKKDKEGREVFCKGMLGDISLDEFTGQIYRLRFESQIELTYGGQVIPHTPYRVKAKKLTHDEKEGIVSILSRLAEESDSKYTRRDAISALGEIGDSSVIPILQGYLNNEDPETRLAAARALIHIAAFPEQ